MEVRIAAVLLALVALSQPVRAESDLLVCRMTGAVMRACCCPEKAAAETPTLARVGCCDTLHFGASTAPAQVDAQSAHVVSLPAVLVDARFAPAMSPKFASLGRSDVRERRQTAGPPRVPLYLSLRRLLD